MKELKEIMIKRKFDIKKASSIFKEIQDIQLEIVKRIDNLDYYSDLQNKSIDILRYERLMSIDFKDLNNIFSRYIPLVRYSLILWKIYWDIKLPIQNFLTLKNLRNALETAKIMSDKSNSAKKINTQDLVLYQKISTIAEFVFVCDISPVKLFVLIAPIIDPSNAEIYLIEGEKALILMEIENYVKDRKGSEKLSDYFKILKELRRIYVI
ncbi:MAG TPA: hypothetical protein PK103_04690 [Elusimicrobiales bacterium]|nr:hypothetical protein [Elusimicrobiales bacterium]HOL62650.1 hypothetical protein [Elusimicrobiales bacterium]HPO95540.1 hypothetical protein [Elusimicrobiales bacterium]